MSVLALLIALALERGLTRLFHLREPRWLDRYYDWIARRLGAGGTGTRVPVALAAVLVADPEEALDLVEELRLRAGKFLYDYPARLRRTVEVIRRK